MNGTSFKEIEITNRDGETFEGSAELVWTARLEEADRAIGEGGGWEAHVGFAFAYVDGHLYTRHELRHRFGRDEVNRLEAYFEEDALPAELDEYETVHDDDGAAFNAAAILRAAEPFFAIAAE